MQGHLGGVCVELYILWSHVCLGFASVWAPRRGRGAHLPGASDARAWPRRPLLVACVFAPVRSNQKRTCRRAQVAQTALATCHGSNATGPLPSKAVASPPGGSSRGGNRTEGSTAGACEGAWRGVRGQLDQAASRVGAAAHASSRALAALYAAQAQLSSLEVAVRQAEAALRGRCAA